MSIAKITSKGQVTLPREIREKLHLEVGEKIDFIVDEKTGGAAIIPLNKKVKDVYGMLKNKGRRKKLTVSQMNKAVEDKFKKEK